MSKKGKLHRVTEGLKTLLILLLTCSALWLAARTQLFGPFRGLWQEEEIQSGTVQTESGARADAARPLRITVTAEGLAENIRRGIQYDAAETDALFQSLAGLLAETLSSVGAPEEISRSQWEQALGTAPGVCLDFQGELPLSVLSGWLTGTENALPGCARRVHLGLWQGAVALCYKETDSGRYYRCLSEVANVNSLAETLDAARDNGAVFAFEDGAYAGLNPDTLVTSGTPEPGIYTAANPMSGGRTALEELMEELGISVDASSFYSSGDEQVARTGEYSLRLSDRGRAEFQAGETGSLFPVSLSRSGATLFESVETCRRLAAVTVGAHCGEARLYLMYAREGAEGLEICFGYSLNGAVVRQEEGCAARFLIREGRVVQFQMNFRFYAAAGTGTPVLPLRQAAAAMEALDLAGEELLLIYNDTGAETVTAGWAAIDHSGANGG